MENLTYCRILDTNINVISMQETLDYITGNIEALRGKYICVSNVHTTVMSYEDEAYNQIQNGAALALPDGKPLSVVSRKRGFADASRVTGPDLMGEFFKRAQEYPLRHYFYGGTKETLEILGEKLRETYPALRIAGMYSPPFRTLTQEELDGVYTKINATLPDIVWIGLGAPKQEKFMYDNRGKLSAVMIGVGAGFDYHAGRIKRAPAWMQKCSLEWLYRLFQDPARLFKRYFITNFKFLYYIFLENIRGKKH
ncbi:MAG: WecB/TagA/CpsF family glycosyltransferase [Alistipes sp.]|nr:WecB/TagA/CpsF family glycosyltransferase [Alistipes sp.]